MRIEGAYLPVEESCSLHLMHSRQYLFRVGYEWVQKSFEELALDEFIYGHDAVFPVNAFTAVSIMIC